MSFVYTSCGLNILYREKCIKVLCKNIRRIKKNIYITGTKLKNIKLLVEYGINKKSWEEKINTIAHKVFRYKIYFI